jgi:hypothetical protein
MTAPDPTPEDAALREVQEAYRDLPRAEPSAALDARVRVAVAAEVGTEPASTPRRDSRVLAFARWRRAALPFAAAAAVLVAIGVNQLEQRPEMHYVARSDAPTSRALESAPAPAKEIHEERARLEPTPTPPPPPAFRPPTARAPVIDLPVVMGPPPAAKAAPANEAAELAAAQRSRADAMSSRAGGAMSEVAPMAALSAAPTASPAPAAVATPPMEGGATFEQIRRLLAEHRRDAARAILKRWRETHPDAPLPADLKALETDARH